MFYEEPGDFMPVIRNVWVENLQVEDGGKYGVLVNAYEESPVENLRLINCTINGVEEPVKVNHVKDMEFVNVIINKEPYQLNGNTARK